MKKGELLYSDLMDRYGQRISDARLRLEKTWWHENHDRPAIIMSDVNYALCGQYDIPENYYAPAVMFRYQMKKIIHHLEHIPDDYVPVLHPWYGTTVVPSALGVDVVYPKGEDPSLGRPILQEPEDILKLQKPDMECAGQMPQVLACIDYMKNHTDVPVCVTDCQGPLNIALGLAGVENLFIWMYEEPEAVHRLMQFCTDVLVDWVKLQKRHAGHPVDGAAYPHAIEMPVGFGGVAFSDDDVVAMSAEMYKTFVVPYNQRLMATFGGGSMHLCGSARHQLDTITGMTGLKAVNNFCMGDHAQIRKLRDMMRGKGAVMACDFNAEDMDWHCNALTELAKQPEGLVLGIFIAPRMVLLESGKYAASQRTTEEVLGCYVNKLKEADLL